MSARRRRAGLSSGGPGKRSGKQRNRDAFTKDPPERKEVATVSQPLQQSWYFQYLISAGRRALEESGAQLQPGEFPQRKASVRCPPAASFFPAEGQELSTSKEEGVRGERDGEDLGWPLCL